MHMAMAGFNVVDWIVLGLLVIGIADGARRGLSGEIATLASTVASGFAAWKFSGWARELILKNMAWTAQEATIAGVAVMFVAVYIVLWILRKSIAAMMNFNFKGKAERIGGALSGLVRYAVITACLLLVATFIPNKTVQKSVTEDSVVGSFVSKRVRPMYEDLSKKHGIPLPVDRKGTDLPPEKDVPPIRDADSAPPDVITNEVPAGMPYGPVK
jgi:uncharacterized membrane protein required for colicin V production